MNEYFGIYNVDTKKWIMSDNILVFYPAKEIAEAHLSIVGREYRFEVRPFKKSEEINQKKKTK